ncbi:galactose-specific lectin nattectin-like [Sardina pilchardus]|uniref:galactose-specific lectin nattectin-like n=1 Tax=Sardina pilchardus TaxID=27697 RepID=UPI002E0EB2EA
MQQSSGPSRLTRMHQHRTDDQDEEQQTAGKFCCIHSARSKVKLILPVLIPGLLLLTVGITARVVAGCKSIKRNHGWESHGGQCYVFSTKYLNWTQSQEECVRMKSHLAIINDEEEQKLLMGIIKGKMKEKDDKFWIGLNDRQTEGVWRWVDNTPLNTNKTFWNYGQPDDWKGRKNKYPDGEDCVRMGEKNFKGNSAAGWCDAACEREFKFICEAKVCS